MEKQSFNLAGKIEALDLRSLSVFTQEAIGHTIKTGQLDADIKLVANDNILDSQVDITLQHFDIEAASAEDQEKIDAELGFPLNTSLSLIKDKNNRISISNSVTGDLDSPEFDLNTIVVRTITTALTETILSFYTGFGLISLDDGKLSLGASLKFKPVAFENGSDDMTEAGTASLEKMAELMNERPNLHVTLCAFTNTKDRKKVLPRTARIQIAKLELDKRQMSRLEKLSEKRQARVRDFLVERKIAADRLVQCQAMHEEGEGLAGVDISI
jgi:outer membrane protein OmpA-like peptidoglycan-associated protein